MNYNPLVDGLVKVIDASRTPHGIIMNVWTRILLGVLIGVAIGATLGAAAGALTNEGLSRYGGLLIAASGGISAGIVAVLLRPKPKS